MPDAGLGDAVTVGADALRCRDWGAPDEPLEHRKHDNHRHHWECAVCNGDVDALARVVLSAVVESGLLVPREQVDALRDEVDRLNHEVMAHQVSAGYEKGYEHGSAAAAKYQAERDALRERVGTLEGET